MQVLRDDHPLWSKEVLFSWNLIAALNSFFWQLHFHPIYFLFIEAHVLGQSWMSCGFSQRGHHPQLGHAKDHVRNCSPLQDKVSWPSLSHIPLQSKQSWLLCTEMNHDLSNGPWFGPSVGSVSPEEKAVAGSFWGEEFLSWWITQLILGQLESDKCQCVLAGFRRTQYGGTCPSIDAQSFVSRQLWGKVVSPVRGWERPRWGTWTPTASPRTHREPVVEGRTKALSLV